MVGPKKASEYAKGIKFGVDHRYSEFEKLWTVRQPHRQRPSTSNQPNSPCPKQNLKASHPHASLPTLPSKNVFFSTIPPNLTTSPRH